MQLSVYVAFWKKLNHFCPSNPIRMGQLCCKGSWSANRKHFSCIKRMTITRRVNVTKTEAGHQFCAVVITHIQQVTPELDFISIWFFKMEDWRAVNEWLCIRAWYNSMARWSHHWIHCKHPALKWQIKSSAESVQLADLVFLHFTNCG